jgi:hypothetical protein
MQPTCSFEHRRRKLVPTQLALTLSSIGEKTVKYSEFLAIHFLYFRKNYNKR